MASSLFPTAQPHNCTMQPWVCDEQAAQPGYALRFYKDLSLFQTLESWTHDQPHFRVFTTTPHTHPYLYIIIMLSFYINIS
jgi:hypothetical protein